MTVVADARPQGINIPFRPGNTLTVELTWPAGQLLGRTFTSTLGGVSLACVVVGDSIVVEASEAQTAAVSAAATWLLTETTGGATNDLFVGTWVASTDPGTPASLTIPVAVGDVDVTVTVVSGQASVLALNAAKVDRAGDTMTGPLVVSAASTITGTLTLGVGAVPLTTTASAAEKPATLDVAGAVRTFHDFALIPAGVMATDGTAPTVGQTVPRCVLAKGQSVSWAREIPAGWPIVSTNFLWMKESATSGNVHWQVAYKIVNFLTGGSMSAALTVVDVGGVAVPGSVGASAYTIPAGTQSIASPQQAFGLPPMLHVQLTRLNDGTDTYAGSVGVSHCSVSRTG